MPSKKPPKTRPRDDWAYATVSTDAVGEIRIQYDAQTDTISFPDAEPGSTRTERSYERDSGKPKIVSSVPSSGPTSFDAEDAIMSFGRVLAIDTNTRIIGGSRCGICVSYFVPEPLHCYTDAIPFEVLGLILVHGIVDGVNPEQIGWKLTIDQFLTPYRAAHGTLAIVVDSELGLHRAINARATGYYRDWLLPDGASLVYASADTDKESLQGQMIRMCDAMATLAGDQLARADLDRLTHVPAISPDYEWHSAIALPQHQTAR